MQEADQFVPESIARKEHIVMARLVYTLFITFALGVAGLGIGVEAKRVSDGNFGEYVPSSSRMYPKDNPVNGHTQDVAALTMVASGIAGVGLMEVVRRTKILQK